MRKYSHLFAARLTNAEWEMYRQLLKEFPVANMQRSQSSRFRILLKCLSKLESYREKQVYTLPPSEFKQSEEEDDEDPDSNTDPRLLNYSEKDFLDDQQLCYEDSEDSEPPEEEY